MYGDYLQVDAKGPLTFIPPSMYGPPWTGRTPTHPASSSSTLAKAPWRGYPGTCRRCTTCTVRRRTAASFAILLNYLLPKGRQLKTNAHPLVEVSGMKHGEGHLVQLMNISGHSETGYYDAIPMSDVKVCVQGNFRAAKAIKSGQALPLTLKGGYTEFSLGSLEEYELVDIR
jgi:hypothetical protein